MRLALWPSIDLSEGRVVRLLRGEISALTTYDSDPEELVARFAEEGADGVHVVDLDAAFGRGDNEPSVRRLLRAPAVPVQVGGGLRTLAAVARALDAGAARVVVGSLPFADPPLFEEVMRRHGARTVVALDCRDSRPSIRGWTADAGAGTAADAARRLAGMDVRALLVTDVARDGAMAGPNAGLLRDVRSVFAGEVLASGGVRGPEDLPAVAAALEGGPGGVVLGRAIHEGRTTVARLALSAGRAGAAEGAGR